MNPFNFNLIDTLNPHDVVKESLKDIDEATQGYVWGVIQEYDGEITSYSKKTGIGRLSLDFSGTQAIDIQEDLGEIDELNHRYEVFITGKGLNNYKYRMMFIDYGTVSYPVKVVLNEDLASEYSGQSKTDFSIKSMIELQEMMNTVINSDFFFKILQNLIFECIRRENIQKKL